MKSTLLPMSVRKEMRVEICYTTGQIFSDSDQPDVVFASVKGVVTVFANLV